MCPRPSPTGVAATRLPVRQESSLFVPQHIPQHRVQNPPVPEVLNLHRRIDPADAGELHRVALGVTSRDLHLLHRLEVVADFDVEDADAGEAEGAAVLAALELEG